ncbi:MAG TPA: acylphosphatase [Steroidobacteraceae bacterium]
MKAQRCWVSGRVQGVFYRASAAQRATELGLCGYARNLSDGRVEVLAVGSIEALRQFTDWLAIGPTAARVSEVRIEEDAAALANPPRGFTVR